MAFISASAQVTLLNPAHFFVFSLEDSSAPGVSLESIQPPQPYGNPIEVTFLFNCVAGHLYTVKVWESPDDQPQGVVRCSYTRAVANQSIAMRDPIYAQVGLTPGWDDGEDTVVDSSLVNWNYILRCNPDYLVPDSATGNNTIAYTKNSDGFTLTGGRTLQDEEQWIIEFVPQIINSSTNGPSNVFGDGIIVTEDTEFDGSYSNKAISIQSDTNKITCKMMALSAVPAYTWVYIYSIGGSHINATIEVNGTDNFMYNGLKTQLILGQGEILKVYKAPFGSAGAYVWYIDQISDGIKEVGQLISAYKTGETNTVQCAGQLLNRAEYPRLWQWVQTLQTGVTVTDTVWNTPSTINGQTIYTNKAKFSAGNGTTTFRMPLLSQHILRPVDGSSTLAGAFDYQDLMAHVHLNGIADDGNQLFVFGGTTAEMPGFASRTVTSESNARNFQGITSETGGSDNKPNTTGVYLLMKI